MRPFLAMAMTMLATQSAAATKPAKPLGSPPKAECKKTTAHPAWGGQPVKPQKLNELPPADMYAAMVRTVDGCEAPLILTRMPKKR